jgi:hypothetical protein
MKNQVTFQVLTPRPLTRKEDGRRFLDLWLELLPEYAPQRYSLVEPIRTPFDPERIDEVLGMWTNQLLFVRKQPHALAHVFMRSYHHELLADIPIRFEIPNFRQDPVIRFLEALSVEFSADFALIHGVTEEVPNRHDFFVTEHQLKKSIPYLPWLTIFGPPYIELFGKERLLSTPAHKAKALDEQHVSIQLTPDIMDLVNHYRHPDAGYEAARQAVLDHLDSNAFHDPALGKDHQYNVPHFDLDRFWDDEEARRHYDEFCRILNGLERKERGKVR